MEFEGSSPCKKGPATGTWSDEFNPHAASLFSTVHFNITSRYLRLDPLNCVFPSGFPTKTMYVCPTSSKSATFSVILTPLEFLMLIFGEKYTSSSVLLHPIPEAVKLLVTESKHKTI
jgi:hypothetical protein